MERMFVDRFPALSAIPDITHGFTRRIPGIDVQVDRDVALERLDQEHRRLREQLGLADRRLITATQVHGATVAAVTSNTAVPVPECDGLITNDPAACLGIYVADCGAVFLVDPVKRVIALIHSGRKGTEQRIASHTIDKMVTDFGCVPGDIVAQVGPCIRPPHYEIDFAAAIGTQLREAGVRAVHDEGICTASNPDQYYSYRLEKGKTGRMLALLALNL